MKAAMAAAGNRRHVRRPSALAVNGGGGMLILSGLFVVHLSLMSAAAENAVCVYVCDGVYCVSAWP